MQDAAYFISPSAPEWLALFTPIAMPGQMQAPIKVHLPGPVTSLSAMVGILHIIAQNVCLALRRSLFPSWALHTQTTQRFCAQCYSGYPGWKYRDMDMLASSDLGGLPFQDETDQSGCRCLQPIV
jgi:hypothetical protein